VQNFLRNVILHAFKIIITFLFLEICRLEFGLNSSVSSWVDWLGKLYAYMNILYLFFLTYSCSKTGSLFYIIFFGAERLSINSVDGPGKYQWSEA